MRAAAGDLHADEAADGQIRGVSDRHRAVDLRRIGCAARSRVSGVDRVDEHRHRLAELLFQPLRADLLLRGHEAQAPLFLDACGHLIGECIRGGPIDRRIRETTHAIELCVVEAVSNSVRHAYRGEAGHVVTVEVHIEGEGLEIRVLDQGLPVPAENRIPREPDFDPADIASIPEGGRGTFLMHSLMDSVTYGLEGGSNVLVLKRALRRGV